ncbi:MAG TPA: hypothetical protein VJ723_10155, partial [Candidatus Angelobacter sp.]|nr:hypothetical protein [Candidatus Angelobacter sp.]
MAGIGHVGAQTAETPSAEPAQARKPVIDNDNQAPQQGLMHIVPFGKTTTVPPPGAHLTYFGGPVISSIHVVVVFWGTNVNPAITADGAIDQFFTDITQSRYYDLLTEYSTVGVTATGGASSNQSINRGSFDGKFTITPSISCPSTCSLTDAQIAAELNSQINAGHLPPPVKDGQGNVESFYMIYFPPDITIFGPGQTGQSCVDFCAYHFHHPNTLVPYGVMPDFAPPSACSLGCGSGTLFKNITAAT